MSYKDLHNSINVKRVISPVSVADNTAQVGQVVDSKGFGSLEYIIETGSIADVDATFAVLLEESDASGSGYTSVADADLLGSEALAGFIFSDDNKVFKLGYKGIKRYTRLTITPTGNASAALISAIAVLGAPDIAATINPPV
jgi:hypothetical protein